VRDPGNKSTAFHPQSDGQTERVNQVLEQYLRIFCDYQQDNWVELLPLAEFAYNNAKHASTQVSPFMANYGRHPRMAPRTLTIENPENSETNPAAEHFLKHMYETQKQLVEQLSKAQDNYKRFYDRKTKAPPEFKTGDLVWLNRRNIATLRPSQKLDHRRLGPFKVIGPAGSGSLAYRLELPSSMGIHPVFHVSLLERCRTNTIPGRIVPAPPPIEVQGQTEWIVEEILDSKISRRKLFYFVDWHGFGPDERTWEPPDHLANTPEKIAEFHRRYPQRPSPRDVVRR